MAEPSASNDVIIEKYPKLRCKNSGKSSLMLFFSAVSALFSFFFFL